MQRNATSSNATLLFTDELVAQNVPAFAQRAWASNNSLTYSVLWQLCDRRSELAGQPVKVGLPSLGLNLDFLPWPLV
jgi:hypothetical protein